MSKSIHISSLEELRCPLCDDECFDHAIGPVRVSGVSIQVRCMTHGILQLYFNPRNGKINNEHGEELFRPKNKITKKRREYLERIKGKPKDQE